MLNPNLQNKKYPQWDGVVPAITPLSCQDVDINARLCADILIDSFTSKDTEDRFYRDLGMAGRISVYQDLRLRFVTEFS
jgi:hypothetical protein